MALVEFKNLPDTSTPLNAENLNNNFKKDYILLKLTSNQTITTDGSEIPFTVVENTNPTLFQYTNNRIILNYDGEIKVRASGKITVNSSSVNTGDTFIHLVGAGSYIETAMGNKINNQYLDLVISPVITKYTEYQKSSGNNNIFFRANFTGSSMTLQHGTYSPGCVMLVEIV